MINWGAFAIGFVVGIIGFTLFGIWYRKRYWGNGH